MFYIKINDVSRGSPLGPITANIFMGDCETKHMDDQIKPGFNTWLRYVNDTFVVINNKNQAEEILEF